MGRPTDLTAEFGGRKQIAPRLVADLGVVATFTASVNRGSPHSERPSVSRFASEIRAGSRDRVRRNGCTGADAPLLRADVHAGVSQLGVP